MQSTFLLQITLAKSIILIPMGIWYVLHVDNRHATESLNAFDWLIFLFTDWYNIK